MLHFSLGARNGNEEKKKIERALVREDCGGANAKREEEVRFRGSIGKNFAAPSERSEGEIGVSDSEGAFRQKRKSDHRGLKAKMDSEAKGRIEERERGLVLGRSLVVVELWFKTGSHLTNSLSA